MSAFELDGLHTPIAVKHDAGALPRDPSVFYLLARTGMYLVRNTPLFTSSVKLHGGPSELRPHSQGLDLSPRLQVPARIFDPLISFFREVGFYFGAEAAALLLFDRKRDRIAFHIPPQRALVFVTPTGERLPCTVEYDVPVLPPRFQLIGDLHSHVGGSAYASATDRADEHHRPGLHLVVGRIFREKPEYSADFVVDGTRFRVEPRQILERPCPRRVTSPVSWLNRVRIDYSRMHLARRKETRQ